MKLKASSHLLWLYNPVVSDQGGNPEARFSHDMAISYWTGSRKICASMCKGHMCVCVLCVGGYYWPIKIIYKCFNIYVDAFIK